MNSPEKNLEEKKKKYKVVTEPLYGLEWEIISPIKFRGTVGMGDVQLALNTAHMSQKLLKSPVGLNFYWNHPQDYLFHCEDPETIIERCDFIHSQYHECDKLEINHFFEDDYYDSFNSHLHQDIEQVGKGYRALKGINSWAFNIHHLLGAAVKPKKVVVWRPTFNATKPQPWKLSFGERNWDVILESLAKNGYNIVELCYRTPVREAFYHLKECSFFVGYDGMWHYIARNFFKRGIVLGDSGIIRNHNPQALLFFNNNSKNAGLDIYEWLDRIPELESKMDKICNEYRLKVGEHIFEN